MGFGGSQEFPPRGHFVGATVANRLRNSRQAAAVVPDTVSKIGSAKGGVAFSFRAMTCRANRDKGFLAIGSKGGIVFRPGQRQHVISYVPDAVFAERGTERRHDPCAPGGNCCLDGGRITAIEPIRVSQI